MMTRTKLAAALTTLVLGLSASAQEIHRQTFLSSEFDRSSSGVPVAFFDADSTLRISRSGSHAADNPHDYILLPGVASKIAELNKQGYLVAIISNQAGIPDFVSLADADAALSNMIQELKSLGATVNYFDFAENKDEFRKPAPGMGQRLEDNLRRVFGANFSIDKHKSYMVGDSAYKAARKSEAGETRPDGRPGFNYSNSDRLFAENYGIPFHEPQDFFGWKNYGVELIENKQTLDDLRTRMGLPHLLCSKVCE